VGEIHVPQTEEDAARVHERPTVVALAEAWWPNFEPPTAASVACLVEGVRAAPRPGFARPALAGIDRDLVQEGEQVEVDGTRGLLRIRGVTEREVVTAFLERPDGAILLLRRSERVGSFRGRWAGVSGFLEDPTPLDQARREVREETGVQVGETDLLGSGRLVYARDGSTVYVVHPFRFRVSGSDVTLDWEHTESVWIRPEEMANLATVPKLDRAWDAVRCLTSEAKANPRE
jgi:8-oxo-dGTP diphosphatase